METKNIGNSKIFNLNIFIYLISLFIFVIIFILITDLIDEKNKEKNQNLNSLVETNDFLNLTDHIITKINNPYKEIKYLIQNNDSIEKILKN